MGGITDVNLGGGWTLMGGHHAVSCQLLSIKQELCQNGWESYFFSTNVIIPPGYKNHKALTSFLRARPHVSIRAQTHVCAISNSYLCGSARL